MDVVKKLVEEGADILKVYFFYNHMLLFWIDIYAKNNDQKCPLDLASDPNVRAELTPQIEGIIVTKKNNGNLFLDLEEDQNELDESNSDIDN